MFQRDYLKRQIDQIAAVLRELLLRLLRAKSQEQPQEMVRITYETLQRELGFDLEKSADMPDKEFLLFLQEKKLSDESLTCLADILYLISQEMKETVQDSIYRKCLCIYEYLENASLEFSFDRHFKIEEIKNRLSGESGE